ncbi:MAG: hypothetical protein JXN63_04580 [Candidatus Delongbacteria bacterium]|nr:hypothetical protein [Candidatus Delongbacteria bacterium]
MHYRAKYRRYLSEEKFKKAEEYSRLYYEAALKTEDPKLIGNCLSTRGAYLYGKDSFIEYETTLLESKNYNLSHRNLHDACNDISNLLSLYTYSIDKDFQIIEELVSELDSVSRKTGNYQQKYNSLLRLAIYYFTKGELLKSENLFLVSLSGTKKYLSQESVFTNLYYLGRIYFDREEYSKAVRYLLALARDTKKYDNKVYMFHSYRMLTKIFIIRKDHKRAVGLINKVIVLAKQLNLTYASGEFFDYYGDICRTKNMERKALYNYYQAIKYFERFSIDNNYDLSEKIIGIKSKIECCK